MPRSPRPARLPRARGDRPARRTGASSDQQASPRARGSTCQGGGSPPGSPGFPARAGIDLFLQIEKSALQGLPRARGDRPSNSFSMRESRMASPRARGSTREHQPSGNLRRGFPARAGIDPDLALRSGVRGRLPRARGDRPYRLGIYIGTSAASPRARGSTPSPRAHHARPPGFPARAGIDPDQLPVSASTARLPRARGDRPVMSPL